ncbi:MAG: phage terminase large subunit [Alphaproteobacteria bacterium]
MLLMAFRGCGKSTLVGLWCAWLLALRPETRILVLAADQPLAVKMVVSVRRIVERHPLCRHLLPGATEAWAADRFTVARPLASRDPSMLAQGLAGNITGSHADIVVCDDVEVPRTSDTAAKRAALRERLGEIDYVLEPGGLLLYAGTPHAFHSIYAAQPRPEAGEERSFLDGFARLEVPLIGPDGASPWPERFPPAAIERLRAVTGPARFASQMLLQPMSAEDGRLDPDRITLYEAELDYREVQGRAELRLDGRRLIAAGCWWDPAFGAPERGDGSVVAAVFVGEDDRRYLHRIAWLTHDPALAVPEADQLCRQVAAFVRDLHLPRVTVERNGLGRFLPGILRGELVRAGVACSVVEHVSRQAKDRRILDALDPLLAAHRLWAHARVWETPFPTEMRDWRPGRRGRDDGLDAVAGAILAEPVRLGPVPPLPRRDWRPGGPDIQAETRFAV